MTAFTFFLFSVLVHRIKSQYETILSDPMTSLSGWSSSGSVGTYSAPPRCFSSPTGYKCIRTSSGAYIKRRVTIQNYESVRFQFDLANYDMLFGTVCKVWYEFGSTSFGTGKVSLGSYSGSADTTRTYPSQTKYLSNIPETYVWVWFETLGIFGTCYWDELTVSGIQVPTPSPTPLPTPSPITSPEHIISQEHMMSSFGWTQSYPPAIAWAIYDSNQCFTDFPRCTRLSIVGPTTVDIKKRWNILYWHSIEMEYSVSSDLGTGYCRVRYQFASETTTYGLVTARSYTGSDSHRNEVHSVPDTPYMYLWIMFQISAPSGSCYFDELELRGIYNPPTPAPTGATIQPTTSPPTRIPTYPPTKYPTQPPSSAPTKIPTHPPTKYPTKSPTESPIVPGTPTKSPTLRPTQQPSVPPTMNPTNYPSTPPTNTPTKFPTKQPTDVPSTTPTENPSNNPSIPPTKTPSMPPTKQPTDPPTTTPTKNPTKPPTSQPTKTPTVAPSYQPSDAPSKYPTFQPSNTPTVSPTKLPTIHPTFQPSNVPTIAPSDDPTNAPTSITWSPSETPTSAPTSRSHYSNRAEYLVQIIASINNTSYVPVRIYNDTAVVGTWWTSDSKGSVQIYERDPQSGIWIQTATLVPNEPMMAGDCFGWNVAIHDGVVVVTKFSAFVRLSGVRSDYDKTARTTAYVFEREHGAGQQSDTWIQTAKLVTDTAVLFTYERLELVIAIYDRFIVIGNADARVDGYDDVKGFVYIFERDLESNIWAQSAMFRPPSDALGALGRSVSIFDEYVVASTLASERDNYYQLKDDGTDWMGGEIFIYKRDTDSNTWAQVDRLKPYSVPDEGGFYYASVAIYGTTVVVGAPPFTEGTKTAYGYKEGETGTAFIFEKDSDAESDSWSQVARVYPNDPDDFFGKSVAIYDNTVVIGANQVHEYRVNHSGSAYIYKKNAVSNTWTQVDYLDPNDNPDGDWFTHVDIYDRYIALTGFFGALYMYEVTDTEAPTPAPTNPPTGVDDWELCIDEQFDGVDLGRFKFVLGLRIEMNVKNKEVLITFTAPTNTWFGIGFGSMEMNNSVVFTVSMDEVYDTINLKRRKLGYHEEGQVISKNLDFHELSIAERNNIRKVTIRTFWTMDDLFDLSDFFEGKICKLPVIWAGGKAWSKIENTIDFDYHGRVNRGVVMVSSCVCTQPPTYDPTETQIVSTVATDSGSDESADKKTNDGYAYGGNVSNGLLMVVIFQLLS